MKKLINVKQTADYIKTVAGEIAKECSVSGSNCDISQIRALCGASPTTECITQHADDIAKAALQ
jgi:hypothetical protein